ncbi:hypothetical protein [Methylovirgula ligni]|uniref:hypothetical protein n=1 Tax=Methylovirgula ligni TaxID=569860 RepID=UPI000E26A478|nr:hypothetical protein [Methylovirgula ligni]
MWPPKINCASSIFCSGAATRLKEFDPRIGAAIAEPAKSPATKIEVFAAFRIFFIYVLLLAILETIGDGREFLFLGDAFLIISIERGRLRWRPLCSRRTLREVSRDRDEASVPGH